MQLTELTLHDFRTYGGLHTIQLKPKSPREPIILFGGLNGAGKTTLLDALQLVLYGKRARCASRGEQSYRDYLRDSIHRNSDLADGSSIELTFTHASEGNLHEYRVSRSWRRTGSGVVERVDVEVDGAPDSVLSEHWEERVDDFAPHRIAHLFFFDGEKIEALADEKQSAQIVRTALHSLLGLDLVDRLKGDLTVLDRKIRKDMRGESDKAALETLDKGFTQLKSQLEGAHSERATWQSNLDGARKKLSKADEVYRQEGGELSERRAETEREEAGLRAQVAQIRDQLSERMAAGVLPFGQVGALLGRMSDQAAAEGRAQQSSAMVSALEKRDRELVRFVESSLPEIPQKILTAYLAEDRHRREEESASEKVLGLDETDAQALDQLFQIALPAAVSEAKSLASDLERVQEASIRIARLLEETPEEESVRDLLVKRVKAEERVRTLEAECAARDDELARLSSDKDSMEREYLKELSRELDLTTDREQEVRLTEKIAESRNTLDRFRQIILERNLARVESAIFDSFHSLIRKEEMIRSLRIDPDTFAIILTGPDKKAFPNQRLSAGERQLLAVATLWGLARVAGLPLPVVIDTPLGRLDSEHRTRIVNSYFPRASHQVLLLSTDEEIKERRLAELGPYIGRSYLLEYKADEDCTVIEEGYFWI